MQCERIHEILLTDYVDGELSAEKSKEVEAHLSSCSQCREFLAELRLLTEKATFQRANESISQERVWQNIKGQIEEERAPAVVSNPFVGITSWLKDILRLPKPAFALFAVTAVVLIVTVQTKLINRQEIIQPALLETQEYFDEDLLVSQTADGDGYGTDIEEYFL